ncbi:MAG: SH3 domain-containing protein [Candidatus Latescibacteria bacterium]|nr:SH3 domain-containing protein [Candidatus Latescibacterota bacterium]NIO56130.1 SH3 domain-containing protein [Candidatus Latescibacterota bacterium]
MVVETQIPTRQETIREYTSLNAEAKRLLDFKKKNVKKHNQTPCPECATLIQINANKCPHCSSDIGDHTAKIREELGKLKGITVELHELHNRYMECHEEESAAHSFWERAKGFISDPRMREDLKIVLPAFLLFFVLIAALRVMGNGPLFWSTTLAGGFIAYYLLKKSNFRRYVTIDLYRAALVLGLILVISGATTRPLPGWPDMSLNTVEVQRSVANIRESATTNSQVVTTANQGDKLKVLDRQGAWYKVQTKDGQTGWVYSSLVKD